MAARAVGRARREVGSSGGGATADDIGRMNALHRRLALYGAAAAALGGLGIFALVAPAEADAMTLLGGADVQLRLAYSMPAVDKEGKPVSTRKDLIDAAIGNLERVASLGAMPASTAEMRGFAASLQDDFVGAADWYDKARSCPDVEAEQKDVLAFNQARMLAKAGRPEAALACFARHAEALDRRFGHQRAIEEAAILADAGRRDEAGTRLAKVVKAADADVGARLQAGEVYARMGDVNEATNVLVQVAPEAPFANYVLAKLKLQRGEVDSGLDLLAKASNALPTEVKRALREDAHVWSVAAADVRYQAIAGTQPAAPAR